MAASPFAEIGPSLGDIVFLGERFAREEQKPLKHQVRLPGGVTHEINWMRDQARRHGYFDGKSMTDLIFNTEAGRQWYRRMLEKTQHMEKGSAAPPSPALPCPLLPSLVQSLLQHGG